VDKASTAELPPTLFDLGSGYDYDLVRFDRATWLRRPTPRLYACTRVRVEWKSECVMDGESGEQVEDELESATYIIIFHIFHIFKTQLHCTTDRRLI